MEKIWNKSQAAGTGSDDELSDGDGVDHFPAEYVWLTKKVMSFQKGEAVCRANLARHSAALITLICTSTYYTLSPRITRVFAC